jgi:hypothetical protein
MTKLATLTEMIDRTISEILKGVGTSIPGHVLSFDVATQLAKVQIGIEFVDVQGESFNLAPVVNVPVHFSGGDFVLEHQIDEGNEGLIVVSQRCIDGWKEQGGVAAQTVVRKLDMQDALFIPGFRSKPNAISGFNNNGIMLRNKDGSDYIWLKNTGEASIQVSGDINLNGVTIDSTGNIVSPGTISGDVLSAPSVVADGKELVNHYHEQPNDGGGDNEADTGPNVPV